MNPVWCDVLKMYYAIRGDVGGFHSSAYIEEKLKQILAGTCNWHAKVEESFAEYVAENEERIQKGKGKK